MRQLRVSAVRSSLSIGEVASTDTVKISEEGEVSRTPSLLTRDCWVLTNQSPSSDEGRVRATV